MAFFSLWGWEEGSVEGKREPQKHCCCLITQSCLTFLRPCGPLSFASAVHQGPLSTGILQVRTLAWIAVSISRGSLQPMDRTCINCTGRQILDHREHLGSPPNASVLLKMRRKGGSVGAAFCQLHRSCSRCVWRRCCGRHDPGCLWTLTVSYLPSPSGLMALLPRRFSTLSLCWTLLTHSECVDTFSAD